MRWWLCAALWWIAAGQARADATVHIMLSADEHGWMNPLLDKKAHVQRGGAAAVEQLLRRRGFVDPPNTLAAYVVLSSGDTWTGPFESTSQQGAPMAALMRSLGVRAAALGNHEFDFGIDVMAERIREGGFPVLAANARRADGQPTPWQAHTVMDVNGVRIGVVGLTPADVIHSTDPRHLVGIQVDGYEASLRRALSDVRSQGVDAIVVLMHDRLSEALPLVPLLREFNVKVVGLGHRHQPEMHIDEAGPGLQDDVVLCNPGPYWRSLCGITLQLRDGIVVSRVVEQVPVAHSIEDVAVASPAVAAILQQAEARAAADGNRVITTIARAWRRQDDSLARALLSSWKTATNSQVALTNRGGLRQDIDAGPVRVRDIVSALPFNNSLFTMTLQGKQVRELAAMEAAVIEGVSMQQGKLCWPDGRHVQDDEAITVVTHGYLVRGGDSFPFPRWQVPAHDLGVDWREPLIRQTSP
jgi:5'-nucleotidase / UDP-sugar diphosphatase